ncbi:recombinase family protein [Streptomyces violens]|uniref:recombinase family protein n=1 Tax=Streptomyces violens TaxID=66377 RepID=UPI0009987DAA|nr:recombinase family protein [Streptomyces violens]
MRFAFAGRCSTEDLQDPEASRQWQLRRATGLIEPVGGQVVAEYFGSGHSRALPWKRRPRAAELLQALRDPQRGFDAVVIGEPQRTFYGNQFGNTFPLFVHFGVPLWVPEVGGAIDPENEAHDLVMSVFGGMSKGERNRVKIRVRTSMAAQAQLEGRFLGGRPPYGFEIVDDGPHPHPGKAAEGRQRHRLEADPIAAPIVQRIFAEYLKGKGIYAIAEGLTYDGIPCPSAYDRARNPHRNSLAWSKGAIRAILSNPRYTGYEVWNKQRKDEVLLDVEDVTLGHRTKPRWNDREAWIWSAIPVHDALVSREDFQAVEAKRLARAGGRGRNAERKPRSTPRPYALRGLLRCGICHRKMQGNFNNDKAHHRCRYTAEFARTAAMDHPLTIYLREDAILPALDAWIATAFAPARLGRTLQLLQRSQEHAQAPDPTWEAARRTVADCERRLTQYRTALDGGADPVVVTRWINEAQAERHVAQQQLHRRSTQSPVVLTTEQIRTMIDELGGMAGLLSTAKPLEKRPLYEAFGLELIYNAQARVVSIESRPALVCAYGACPRSVLNHSPRRSGRPGSSNFRESRLPGTLPGIQSVYWQFTAAPICPPFFVRVLPTARENDSRRRAG